MKDQIRSHLDAIFKTDSERKAQTKKAQDDQQRKEAEFLAAFYERAEKLIKPAMEELGKYVETKGYSYRIDERKHETGDDGKHRSAAIAFVIMMQKGKYYPAHELPSFTVQCDKYRQKVDFLESTMTPGSGGHSGGVGEASLEGLTEEFIQTKIVKVLNEVFGKK